MKTMLTEGCRPASYGILENETNKIIQVFDTQREAESWLETKRQVPPVPLPMLKEKSWDQYHVSQVVPKEDAPFGYRYNAKDYRLK